LAKYIRRIADEELKLKLQAFGAVLIAGPKWCGKTTTGLQQAASALKLQDPDAREGYLATAATKPSLLLRGDNPRLIDEWQDAPVLWDAVRTAVDDRGEEGLFILTGSTSVDTKKIHHSGTGRIARLRMYPMSLFESGESNGKISLMELFENPTQDIDGIPSTLSIEELVFAAARGGWPSSITVKSDAARMLVAKEYLDAICETDISTVDGVTRNSKRTRLILKSYARNVSSLAKKNAILKDVKSMAEEISLVTLDSYLEALEKLFVIEDMAAWCPAIRSATALRSGYKRELVDPSIAVAALGISMDALLFDMKTFGFVFECLCARDLRIYSEANGGKLSYYRDRYGLEADAVLHLDDGRYALIEFKLGSAEIEEGAAHLLKIQSLLEDYNNAETQVPLKMPNLLLVITGGDIAYTRADGVKIIPIGCLRN